MMYEEKKQTGLHSKTKSVAICMNRKLRVKLMNLYTVKKRFNHENVTISGIVDDALAEYFINHKSEIDELMKRYHDQGGCIEL